MRVALYLRISPNVLTTENQRLALQDVAANRGWQIVDVYEDTNISGAKGRDQRPAFDRLLRDAAKGKFDMIAAWSVDRLGRSLRDLVGFLGDLQAFNVGLFLHQQSLDTSTPSGRAMFSMCGIFAEFEQEMIRARVHAGLARARSQGKTLGRPRASDNTVEQIRALRAQGIGMGKIARQIGCGKSVVQRVCAG